MSRWTFSWIVGLLAVLPASVPAETLYSVPPGDRLAIEAVLDDATWTEARRCLPNASTVGAQYYAVVVNDLDAPGRPSARQGDAVPFVDSAYRAWRAADPSALDPDRHILIGMAIEDRAVAIHPGHRWAEMGLEGSTVTRVIDNSEFGDRARSGDLARAVCTLAEAVDAWIVDEIQTQERARQEATAAAARQREAAAAKAARLAALRQAAPLVFLGAVLLVTLLILLVQLVRVRGLKSSVLAEIESWRERLAIAAERLLELERLHPVYFTATMRRWTGRSRDLDRSCADAVNRVYLLYSRASLLAERAADELQVTGGLRTGPVRRARSFLHSADVVIEEGVPAEAEDRRRIFVPLLREVRTTADQILGELDTAYGEALDLLSTVAALEERHEESRRAADEQAEAALTAIAERRDLGLPVGHLDEELENALADRDKARDELRSDPQSAIELLEPCFQELRSVAQRAELGNRAVERLRTHVTQRARTLRQRIDELRSDGFRLEEPGFQPDLQLDRGAEDATAIETAVAEGREVDARTALSELEHALDDLSAQIEASASARDDLPENALELDSEIQAVRDQLPSARQTLDKLAQRHAHRSWQEESDNVDELTAILEQLDRSMEQIRMDHERQHYLAALEDLTTCRELLDECTDLLREVEIIESVLEGCKSRSQELASQVESSTEALRALRGESGVGAEAEEQITDLAKESDILLIACREPEPDSAADLPDWTELEPRLAALRRGLADLATEVDENLASFADAGRLQPQLTSAVHELLDHVQREERDRPHVEASLRDVASDVTAWEESLELGELGGRELLQQGEHLAARLDWARGVWRSEMDLVRHAESLLRSAEHSAKRQLGRSLGHGVAVDSSAANGALQRARDAARRREWEVTAEAAQTAQSEIDAAVSRAELQYRNRERAERRRLAAAAAMEALRIGVTVAAMGAGRGGRRRRSRLPSWPSRSSASSSMGSLRPRGGFGSGGSRSGGSRSGGSRW
ncbi:MAG: hypothetical protein MPN21_12570 [Thermoanaerobaculia bacterium]|nr:hypothetical protein [Thermoanaerobaculia bacterium]